MYRAHFSRRKKVHGKDEKRMKKKKKQRVNRTACYIIIRVQTEYCGLRSWNLIIKSTKIWTSSSVMALYMAARTPPTSLQTNGQYPLRRSPPSAERTFRYSPVSFELQKPQVLSFLQELLVCLVAGSQAERHGYAASGVRFDRTRVETPRVRDGVVQ